MSINNYSYTQSTGDEPPLNQPYYGAPLPAAVARLFKKYARFEGYASRSEYWWPQLVYCLFGVVVGALIPFLSERALMLLAVVSLIVVLVLFIPFLSLTVRRLHDMGCSGWFYLISFIPLVGPFALYVMLAMPTKPEVHRPEWNDFHP